MLALCCTLCTINIVVLTLTSFIYPNEGKAIISLYHIKHIVEKFNVPAMKNQKNGREGESTVVVTSESNKVVKQRIIIHSRYRTGSTLTSEFLDGHRDIFYMYEPFKAKSREDLKHTMDPDRTRWSSGRALAWCVGGRGFDSCRVTPKTLKIELGACLLSAGHLKDRLRR